jgi:large subunit ribosomal protein L25
MADDTTTLPVSPRTVEGSRANRRLRRSGLVPGVVYGGEGEPLAFQVDARTLRQALAHAGAVMTLALDGEGETPVVLKDQQRHPVTGATLHVDLLRVDLRQRITATVVLELTGADDAPGVKAGGVLEQVTRELSIEALPTDIPEAIGHDVSVLEIGDTITLAAVSAPAGVTLLDDPETVIVTVTPPRLSVDPSDEIETETEVVGEGGGEAEASADGESSEGGE